MKNNKGFTLVELIAVVAILLVLGFMVTPKVIDIIDENRIKAYKEIEKRLEEAAAKYLAENYVDSRTETVRITKDQLIEGKYIGEIYDLKDKTVCDGYVLVKDLNTNANYNSMLQCSSYKSNISKLFNTGVEYINYLFSDEEEKASAGLVEPKLTDGTSTGIRYAGSTPKNYVYYNCDDKDSKNVAYGNAKYDYKNSCEKWRIIGVFDVKKLVTDVTSEKRIKLIYDSSVWGIAWDTSFDETVDDAGTLANNGRGINQWGESKYSDGTTYPGSDLMQILNGYYLKVAGKTCTYCSSNSCTRPNTCRFKQLGTKSQDMIDDALWHTGAVRYIDPYASSSTKVKLEEIYKDERKGDTSKPTCSGTSCNDKVIRTATWTGKVGLIYPSDAGYASADPSCPSNVRMNYSTCENQNWITPHSYYWTISPRKTSSSYYDVYTASSFDALYASLNYRVRPSVYLKNSVKITGGDGTSNSPYTLGI